MCVYAYKNKPVGKQVFHVHVFHALLHRCMFPVSTSSHSSQGGRTELPTILARSIPLISMETLDGSISIHLLQEACPDSLHHVSLKGGQVSHTFNNSTDVMGYT